jgi:hypothetical protein
MDSGLDLDAVERPAELATPSPWHVRFLDDDHAMNAIGIAREPDTGEHEDMATFSSPGSELLAATLIQAPPYVVSEDRRWGENAELIVLMRNALPELLRLARIGRRAEQSDRFPA